MITTCFCPECSSFRDLDSKFKCLVMYKALFNKPGQVKHGTKLILSFYHCVLAIGITEMF